MTVTRIGPSATQTFEAIKDALETRHKAGAISELTDFQVVEGLKPISRGSRSTGLAAQISNLEKETNIPSLKGRLTSVAIARRYLKGNLPEREDAQSASQIRDQFQQFELIIAGKLEGITVIPESAGMLKGLNLSTFLDFKHFGAQMLDDPRKLPLFYTAQNDIDFDQLKLNDAQLDKLKQYLFKRDQMLSRDTVEVTDTSRPFLVDDLNCLSDPTFLSRINRGIKSPIATTDQAIKAINNVKGSRIRFDVTPSSNHVDISTYMTFKELQANFGSGNSTNTTLAQQAITTNDQPATAL